MNKTKANDIFMSVKDNIWTCHWCGKTVNLNSMLQDKTIILLHASIHLKEEISNLKVSEKQKTKLLGLVNIILSNM